MHPVKNFDQAVLVVLIDGIEDLRSERDIEIFVIHKAHLRRAIQVLLVVKAIDQVQSDALMQDVATAWQQTLRDPQGGVEILLDEEQHLAVLHAQEFLHLIADAESHFLCGQVLERAQCYFQSLKQCDLIALPLYDALNHHALILVDDWKRPQG
jgi:hypothetical protein